ncbi:hypothetical protein E4U60_003514 [Claviceps pazoutovae]|uniref:Uncharacterized protein n=1 Tax=Claviceps pazoutovae TaxID=1649127 RepID=A0A9P7SGC8_9HYPO|nr:hypothetical protein E4U60_003514 [Claviceps pazoutovae]
MATDEGGRPRKTTPQELSEYMWSMRSDTVGGCSTYAGRVTIDLCMRKSFVWPRLRQLALRTNMRVRGGEHGDEFVHWVQSVPYDPALRSMVTLPAYVERRAAAHGVGPHRPHVPRELLREASQDHSTFAGRYLLCVYVLRWILALVVGQHQDRARDMR